jgi:hypothetical protein
MLDASNGNGPRLVDVFNVGLHGTAMRLDSFRRHPRASTALLGAIVAATTLVAVITFGGSPIRAPIGGVPWIDAPASNSLLHSLNRPLPPPPPLLSRVTCGPGDLSYAGEQFEATGSAPSIEVVFRNVGPVECMIRSRPSATAYSTAAPPLPPVVGEPAGLPSFGELAAVLPGRDLLLQLYTFIGCDSFPGEESYHDVEIAIPGDGDFSITRSISIGCRTMSVSRLYVPRPQPTYAIVPADFLIARMVDLPATAAAGSTVAYGIEIINPTGHAVALSPCPVYMQDTSDGQKLIYRMNCTGGKLTAHGHRLFQMRLPIPPGTAGGRLRVWWTFVAPNLNSARGIITVDK